MKEAATTPPEPQRLRALEQANAVRLARAELKRRIAEGEVSAAEVILGCPDEARRWTLADLLVSQRRWGSTRCRKFLERNNISEIKPIGALTERQRLLLAGQLGNCRTLQDRDDYERAPEQSAPVMQERELVYA
jgi:hypothetical protein